MRVRLLFRLPGVRAGLGALGPGQDRVGFQVQHIGERFIERVRVRKDLIRGVNPVTVFVEVFGRHFLDHGRAFAFLGAGIGIDRTGSSRRLEMHFLEERNGGTGCIPRGSGLCARLARRRPAGRFDGLAEKGFVLLDATRHGLVDFADGLGEHILEHTLFEHATCFHECLILPVHPGHGLTGRRFRVTQGLGGHPCDVGDELFAEGLPGLGEGGVFVGNMLPGRPCGFARIGQCFGRATRHFFDEQRGQPMPGLVEHDGILGDVPVGLFGHPGGIVEAVRGPPGDVGQQLLAQRVDGPEQRLVVVVDAVPGLSGGRLGVGDGFGGALGHLSVQPLDQGFDAPVQRRIVVGHMGSRRPGGGPGVGESCGGCFAHLGVQPFEERLHDGHHGRVVRLDACPGMPGRRLGVAQPFGRLSGHLIDEHLIEGIDGLLHALVRAIDAPPGGLGHGHGVGHPRHGLFGHQGDDHLIQVLAGLPEDLLVQVDPRTYLLGIPGTLLHTLRDPLRHLVEQQVPQGLHAALYDLRLRLHPGAGLARQGPGILQSRSGTADDLLKQQLLQHAAGSDDDGIALLHVLSGLFRGLLGLAERPGRAHRDLTKQADLQGRARFLDEPVIVVQLRHELRSDGLGITQLFQSLLHDGLHQLLLQGLLGSGQLRVVLSLHQSGHLLTAHRRRILRFGGRLRTHGVSLG